MAIFGFGKKKKEEEQPTDFPGAESMASELPVQQVLQFKQQGYTNDQIIQTLQQQGFKSYQIFDTLNQAEMQSAGTAGPLPMQAGTEAAEFEVPAGSEVTVEQEQPYSIPPPPPMPTGQAPAAGAPEREATRERIEEVAEAIIDEKWNNLVKDINKVIEWKERTEARVAKIEQQLADIKNNFDALHKGVLGKISEYDQNLTNVGVEIKAMEKVFQKVLPTFTENVAKLDRITRDIKGGNRAKRA